MPLRQIFATDVSRIFDEASICELAAVLKLPHDAELRRFGEGVRRAVLVYVDKAAKPSRNALRRELMQLHQLAANHAHNDLAAAIEAMSKSTREMLGLRSARSTAPGLPWGVPSPAELRDPVTRDAACEGLRAMLQTGSRWAEGRMRPSGRRSRSVLVPRIYAPVASEGEPRRAPERALVMWLELAVWETIQPASPTILRKPASTVASLGARGVFGVTANPRAPGPLARFVAAVLVKVGATGQANADGLAVQLINDVHKRRKASAVSSRPGATVVIGELLKD